MLLLAILYQYLVNNDSPLFFLLSQLRLLYSLSIELRVIVACRHTANTLVLLCNGLEYGSVEALLNHSSHDPTFNLQNFPAGEVETPGKLPVVNLDQLFPEPSLDQLIALRVSRAQLIEWLICLVTLLRECMR